MRASFLNRLSCVSSAVRLLWEKLERDFAPESLVPREIDLAHSADADERLDPVMTNQFSDQCAGAVVSQKFGSDFKGR